MISQIPNSRPRISNPKNFWVDPKIVCNQKEGWKILDLCNNVVSSVFSNNLAHYEKRMLFEFKVLMYFVRFQTINIST